MISQIPDNKMVTISIASSLTKDYELTSSVIEQGAFGKIYKAKTISHPQKEVCIKTSTFAPIQPSCGEINPIALLVDGLAAIEIIKNNPHQNIVNYYFAGIDTETKELYEIMEFCNGQDVYKYNDLNEDDAFDVCYQVAAGLQHLHSFSITHRDVKSNNILVHKDQNGKHIYKIADFGLSCTKKNLKTVTGNIFFRAPESLNIKPELSNKIDIWGLGIIFYQLIFKEFPFDDKNDDEEIIKNKIKNGFTYPQLMAKQRNVHPKVQELLEGMLEKDPKNRFSAEKVVMKIKEIRNMKTSILPNFITNYKSLDVPINLPQFKMNSSICFGGRGAVYLSNQACFTMDEYGNVQKINTINNYITRQQFDVGSSDTSNSIIVNTAENCLIVSGSSNKNIYTVDLTNLKPIRMWKQTHNYCLTRTMFLDNKLFCAGYSDGLLKKYCIDLNNELASFKVSIFFNYIFYLRIGEYDIVSFHVDSNQTELLVGDDIGVLHSMNWKSFNAKNWSIKVHGDRINSICKSGQLFATGSSDSSVVLLNSLTPPQVIGKVQVDSTVCQLQLVRGSDHLLVLCLGEFVLFKINAGKLEKLCQKLKNKDFKNNSLQSFALLDNNNTIVGDYGGNVFSIKLLKQIQAKHQGDKAAGIMYYLVKLYLHD